MNEKKYKRIFTVVIDSLGAGEMPDASSYGDAGTDTLGHIAANVEEFKIPNLQKLGIANLKDLAGVAPVEKPLAYYGKLREASNGKDTMTRPTFHSSFIVISRAISQQRYNSSRPNVSSFPQI